MNRLLAFLQVTVDVVLSITVIAFCVVVLVGIAQNTRKWINGTRRGIEAISA